jgi:hypothetical protein
MEMVRALSFEATKAKSQESGTAAAAEAPINYHFQLQPWSLPCADHVAMTSPIEPYWRECSTIATHLVCNS